MIKGSINQEDIATLNINAPNNRASKYIKQNLKEEQRETYKWTNRQIIVIAGDPNTLLSIINKSYRQKISKDIEDLDNTSNQLDPIKW